MTKWELKTSYVNKRIQSTRMNKIKTIFFFFKEKSHAEKPHQPIPKPF